MKRKEPLEEPVVVGLDTSVSDQSHVTTQAKDVLMLFRVVFRSVQKHSGWIEKQCPVSSAQLWVMWELLVSPGLRVSDLSRTMAIHQSTTSNLLDKLEKKALLRRERGGSDHRVVRLYLTPAGLDIVKHAPRPAQGVLMEALDSLPEEILDGLSKHLKTLVEALDLKNENSMPPPAADEVTQMSVET